MWDFEQAYKQKVVDYMLDEFRRGRTPNPDIMCNQEIKFKIFYERALAAGADYIATGHYARADGSHLRLAADANKDQTYFLYRMSLAATARTLFPVGDLKKPAVKALAAARGLDVAHKKESTGVCFVGEVGMKDFLQHYLPAQPGEIRELETDRVLGHHDGAIFYTLGQRHGLYLGGGLPYYVVKKDLFRNLLYVSRNLNAADLWTDTLELEDLFLREPLPNLPTSTSSTAPSATAPTAVAPVSVRLRHRAPLIPATFDGHALHFSQPIKRPAAGQSAVLYSDDLCLGGGIIAES